MTNNSELINILKNCEKEAYQLNHPFIGTEHFILCILKYDNSLKSILNNYNITYEKYKSELSKLMRSQTHDNNLIYTPLFKRILLCTNEKSVSNIFMGILEEGEGIGLSILNNMDIDVCKLYSTLKNNNRQHSWGENLVLLARNNKLNKVIGRENEINEIIEILGRKNKCNPLLIGDAGVGKTAIVEGLAIKVAEGNVPDYLKNTSIISLSISSLVSGTRYRGEFEEKMEKLIKEISGREDMIIFIDEIHTLVGAGGAEGAIDASNILKPFLARNKVKCIGSTTINEYNNTIRKDKALDRRFNKIIIKEPNLIELKKILYGVKNEYEAFHKVRITNRELNYIMECTKKDNIKKEPDRSLDLLDNVCTKASIYLRNEGTNKLKNTLNIVIYNKNECLKEGNYKEALEYKRKESNINKLIKEYRPRITNNYIKNIYDNKNTCVKIGFDN